MCTRIFWNDNPIAKTVARCMDWAVSDEPELWYVPAGTARAGDAGDGSLGWVSRHANVAISMWGMGTVDGMNDAGLAVHALYLNPEDVSFPPADERPAVAHTMWVQYLLDNFATVTEAITAVEDIRIVAPLLRGETFGVHIAIEDASGDSAIIEPLGGRMVVHHGREFTVMANSPALDQQLENLARYRPFGGELPPPGDITSSDRFVRAAYFLHYLPEPVSLDEAVAGVVQLIANVSVPYGAPYADGGVYPTWWRSAADLTNCTYFFGSTRSPGIFWIDVPALAGTTEVLRLDPRDTSLVGDETSRLEPAALRY